MAANEKPTFMNTFVNPDKNVHIVNAEIVQVSGVVGGDENTGTMQKKPDASLAYG